jgi:hypothetical protein
LNPPECKSSAIDVAKSTKTGANRHSTIAHEGSAKGSFPEMGLRAKFPSPSREQCASRTPEQISEYFKKS